MKLCSKKILIDTIKPKKNTLHLLCRLTPALEQALDRLLCFFYAVRRLPHGFCSATIMLQ